MSDRATWERLAFANALLHHPIEDGALTYGRARPLRATLAGEPGPHATPPEEDARAREAASAQAVIYAAENWRDGIPVPGDAAHGVYLFWGRVYVFSVLLAGAFLLLAALLPRALSRDFWALWPVIAFVVIAWTSLGLLAQFRVRKRVRAQRQGLPPPQPPRPTS